MTRELNPSQACGNEGLVCTGVNEHQTEEFLDGNNRVQAVHTVSLWLSPYYCDDLSALGWGEESWRINNAIEYVEPYAGPVRFIKTTQAVLCCEPRTTTQDSVPSLDSLQTMGN